MKTIAITGAASGIGAALKQRLEGQGDKVISIDLQNADLIADLSVADGRKAAIDGIAEACGGKLDGLVPCAGLSGLPGRPGSLLVRLNYFGSVELFSGLRECLSAGDAPAAVAMSSNSTTTVPPGMVSKELVAACLEGDEEKAAAIGDEVGSIAVYPASKTALAHWVRRQAPTEAWIGQGINLNAIAPGKTETAMVAEGRADPIIGPHMDAFPVPIGRNGQPEEIAALLGFLLGPEARFIVGSLIFVDGGTDAEARADDYPQPQ